MVFGRTVTLRLLVVLGSISLGLGGANVSKQFVFKHTSELGYMHMSTIELLPNNSLAVAFQAAKSHEGDNDQRIVFKTSKDLGRTWEPHSEPVNGPTAVWGPVLWYHAPRDTLWMFYSLSGAPQARSSSSSYPGGDIMATSSTNQGASWAEPRALLRFTDRGNVSKVTANRLVVTTAGTWILPFWQEGHTTRDIGPSCAGVLRSVDQGLSWAASGCLSSQQAGWLIENSLAQLEDERLLMVFRTKCGKMFHSYSTDDGLTWSAATPTAVDNPNSKICLVKRIDSPGVVLAYNPSTKERTPLALAQTFDGESWSQFASLETQSDNSFDYPTPLQVGGQVFTVYSADRHSAIKMAVADLP